MDLHNSARLAQQTSTEEFHATWTAATTCSFELESLTDVITRSTVVTALSARVSFDDVFTHTPVSVSRPLRSYASSDIALGMSDPSYTNNQT